MNNVETNQSASQASPVRSKKQDFICYKKIEKSDNGRKMRRGKFYNFLNGQTYHSLGGLANSLRFSGYTMKQFYDAFYKEHDEGFCAECGSPTRFNNIVDGYSRFCNKGCHSRSAEHRAIISNRFVGCPEKLELALRRQKMTNAFKSAEERAQRAERQLRTVYDRYGDDYLSNRAKQQWANKSAEERKEIGAKSVAVKRRNGTLNVSGKSGYKRHKIVLGGKEFSYQGYEWLVLKFLVEEYGIDPASIRSGGKIPSIPFALNKSGIYFPDIYIEHLNLLIEAKSNFTFFSSYEDFVINCKKQQAVIDAGYYTFIVCLAESQMKEQDIIDLRNIMNMITSSQDLEDYLGKVQRLSVDTEYMPIAVGHGNADYPKFVG